MARGGGGRGLGRGGEGDSETKTVSQNVERGNIQNSNHLHNIKHVVQSTTKPYDSNFELSST